MLRLRTFSRATSSAGRSGVAGLISFRTRGVVPLLESSSALHLSDKSTENFISHTGCGSNRPQKFILHTGTPPSQPNSINLFDNTRWDFISHTGCPHQFTLHLLHQHTRWRSRQRNSLRTRRVQYQHHLKIISHTGGQPYRAQTETPHSQSEQKHESNCASSGQKRPLTQTEKQANSSDRTLTTLEQDSARLD
jgi:hypothetical protein